MISLTCNHISLSLRGSFTFAKKEYGQKAVFCFCEDKSSVCMYVCTLYQVESHIAYLYKIMIESPQTQLHHGFRCFTRHHRPQDEQIISSYCADILRPPIHTWLLLKMSPSNHYWWRYVIGRWLVFGWFWGCDAPDTWLVRWKLGKKTHPNHGGHCCPMATMVPHSRRRNIPQTAHTLGNKLV